MDTLKQLTLIETTIARRGEGINNSSPIRVITQYWTPKGDLVFERDPCSLVLTVEKRNKIQEEIFAIVEDNGIARKLLAALEDIYAQ